MSDTDQPATAASPSGNAAGSLEEAAAGSSEKAAAGALEETAAGALEETAAGALEEAAAGAINIEHLAALAQLQLTPGERVAVSADLARIIAMVDSMQKIDTSGVEPLAHPLDTSQRLRADEVTEVVDRALNQQGAPATEDGFYLVPRVVE